MSFTPSQSVAFNYLQNANKGSVVINGAAGCGKTYLIGKLIEEYKRKKLSILALAPTHQAKLQIMNAIGVSGVKFNTVAAFLGTKMEHDRITGKKKFVEKGADNKKTNVIVVDESSMLSKSQATKISAKASNTLVIFLADFHQLPPVNGEDARAVFSNMKTFTLTEQKRNAGEILSLCNKLRQGLYWPSSSSNDIDIHDTRVELVKNVVEHLKIDSDPYGTSFLAFTNASVKNARNYIHSQLFGDDEFHAGQFVRIEEGDLKCPFTNGEMCQITKLKHSEIKLFDIDVDSYDVTLTNAISGEEYDAVLLNYEVQDVVQEALAKAYKDAENYWNDFKNNGNEISKNKWAETINHVKQTSNIVFVGSPYAMTVHKSQGRSINNVFVDTADIKRYGRENTKALMYVACSRTRNRLSLVEV